MSAQEDRLTVPEAALELRVTDRRVRAMINRHRLPAEKVGRDWLIKRSDLDLVRDRKPGRPRTIDVADDGVQE